MGVIEVHLKYCLLTAQVDCKETRHPQLVMRSLGIEYQHATPQSVGDQWWFWNCWRLPETLPPYLSHLDVKADDCVGFGLSKKMADEITFRESNPIVDLRAN